MYIVQSTDKLCRDNKGCHIVGRAKVKLKPLNLEIRRTRAKYVKSSPPILFPAFFADFLYNPFLQII